ncbi:MAG: hypothetical protein EP329_24055 [Deltaproteobacteria bacterium]|nr:MAG: hypothetical protein EP329_24055 [Deltaproteobacteria bacterium]
MHVATLRRTLLALAVLLPLSLGACANDPKGEDTVTDALALSGSLDVAEPATGQHTLTITVVDGAGAAVEGATVTVDPEMPMHGHGSSETAVVTEVGGGVYTAFPVTFQMPGMWTVTVTATHGERTGSVDLDYTVN